MIRNLIDNLTKKSDNKVNENKIILELNRQMADELEYFAKLQVRYLNSVYDPVKADLLEDELAECQNNLAKKDYLIKTLYKVGEFRSECNE